MGINKNTKQKMRVIIAIVALIAMSSVMTQAVVPTKKWLCCKNNSMYEPRWDVSCAGSARRLQGMVEQYCPAKLSRSARRMQAVVHPVAANCTNFNSRRRLQAMVVYKCPVNIEGYQCFKNNSNAKCATSA